MSLPMPHEQSFTTLFYRHGILAHRHAARFFLVLPLLRASGKDKTMKRIPKTPIEFDYDLWTTEDGKCMVRVKLTGEVTEVDREVMKVLRAEEKKLRRSYTGSNSEDTEEAEDKNSILSLDALPDDDVTAAAWLADPHDFTNDITTRMLEQEMRSSLTDAQLDLYKKCIIGGTPLREYARDEGINFKCAWKRRELIQKKAKKIWG